jgi:acetoacetate decarboxylase
LQGGQGQPWKYADIHATLRWGFESKVRSLGYVKPLFIAGPGRSGTTALTVYLNEHPEVLVCRERFTGWPRQKITPELFTFERIMDFEDGYEPPHRNTDTRRRSHR